MDGAVFVLTKVLSAFLRPDTWLTLALLIIVLLLWFRSYVFAFRLSWLTLIVVLFIGFIPVGDIILQPIERAFPANPDLRQVDGIIVLGGGEEAASTAYWGQLQLNEGAERYTAALELAHRFQSARILFTGGSGRVRDVMGSDTSEADVAREFFLGQGIGRERLLLEGKSRNTAENARLSLEIAAPKSGETWVLVTSAFHMPRAMRRFEASGWRGLVAWPVDYRTAGFVDGLGWDLTGNLKTLTIAIRERAGQLLAG